jgi:hypothetical protein
MRHAALAWAVDAWCMPLLTTRARRRVRRARAAALRALHGEVLAEPSAELVAEAGLPRASEGRALVRAMSVLFGEGA